MGLTTMCIMILDRGGRAGGIHIKIGRRGSATKERGRDNA